MSGFEPIIAAISGSGSIASTIVTAATSLLGEVANASRNAEQAKYQQAVYQQQQAQAQAQAQSQAAQLQAAYDSDAAERKRRLKAETAARRAAFGASGFETSSSGSANAVLQGLAASTAQEQAESDKTYQLRMNALNQDLAFSTQRNLLASERQFRSSADGLGLVTKGLGLSGGIMKSLL